MTLTGFQLRNRQAVGWVIAAAFVVGFFIPAVGQWTGPILACWFVGTQRPWRGFVWMVILNFVPGLIWHWRSFPLTGAHEALGFVGGMLLGTVLSVLPFSFHRLTSARLPGVLSTLPLPLAAVVLMALPLGAWNGGSSPGMAAIRFASCWFAAILLWIWNHKVRAIEIAETAGLAACVFVLAEAFSSVALPGGFSVAGWKCLLGVVVLAVWAILRPGRQRSWASRPEIALLRSPSSGEPLHAVAEHGREVLVSASGERFPIRGGVPNVLRPEDLTGANLKYNHLYETIGGFYDDSQIVGCMLAGMDRDAYVMSYLGLLEVKPGDRVLETSVGTGLNFKYLPRDIERFGLDLSPEMLTNCKENLRRWQMDADLFLGNAESLPFADDSFDVVFHVGGINFFSDRGKAIREMIRVARPGNLLLIADETEEHVQNAYENIPITSSYYKGRTEAVTTPVDLVPAEMQEIQVRSVFNGRLYALTFRKPA